MAQSTSADRPGAPGPVLAAQVPPDAMVLHIGTHKTGTTALQSALKARRGELRELGVTYPLGHRQQHRACMALVQREFGWAENRPVEEYHRTWAKFADKVRPTPGRVLISSEWLCQADDEQAARAVRTLGAERIHVLVAFRALSRILPSSWQQYLKNGWTARYDEWLGYVLADPPSPKANSSFWQRNDVPATLRRWSELIGADRITVVVSDEADRNRLPYTLADLLGVPREVLAPPTSAVVRSNRSLSVPEAELLLQVNPHARDLMTSGQYTELVRNGAAEKMVEGRTPAPDEPRLGIPAWAVDRVTELSNEHAKALQDSGVHIVGDPAALALVPEPTETGQPVDVPADAAALALLGALEVAVAGGGTPVARMTSRQLVGEVARRAKGRVPRRSRGRTSR